MSESDIINFSSHPQAVSYSRAIVVQPSVVDDSKLGLTLVLMRHRSKRVGIGRHCPRRPFRDFEVEVLVKVVENIGIGRCVIFLFTT